jgi:hypothetical protein
MFGTVESFLRYPVYECVPSRNQCCAGQVLFTSKLTKMFLNRKQFWEQNVSVVVLRLELKVINYVLSEISGSHGGEYEDGYLPGCCAV